jgi:hypothetical protein
METNHPRYKAQGGLVAIEYNRNRIQHENCAEIWYGECVKVNGTRHCKGKTMVSFWPPGEFPNFGYVRWIYKLTPDKGISWESLWKHTFGDGAFRLQWIPAMDEWGNEFEVKVEDVPDKDVGTIQIRGGDNQSV